MTSWSSPFSAQDDNTDVGNGISIQHADCDSAGRVSQPSVVQAIALGRPYGVAHIDDQAAGPICPPMAQDVRDTD